MNFFTELKRRNVFKVGAAYMVVAWLIIQFINNIAGPLNFPTWIPAFFIVLLGMGFPIALILAWAFELTPEGVKLTATVEPEASIRPETGRKLNMLIISGLALALLVVVMDSYVLPDSPAASEASGASGTVAMADTALLDPAPELLSDLGEAIPALSIAVLPFANLSSDAEQEYFSDGLTEELLNQLAQLPDLQVAGRTSSFAFKNRNEDLRVVGESLGVAHILEGSVRKSGNQIRITAQLVKANNGYHLWSQTYDRELTDIFAIQDEIARAVTTALSVTMGAGDFSRPGMTRNIEAYDAFLKGRRAAYDFSGAAAVREAIEQFEQAVGLDPAFAQAWLGLTRIYTVSSQFLTAAQRVDFPARIEQARAQIRAVTPELPELQLVIAQELMADKRLVEAEQVLVNFLDATGSSHAQAALLYGQLLTRVGRSQAALRLYQQARRLEPLDAAISFYLIQAYSTLERFEEASAEIERGQALEGLDIYIAGQRMFLEFQRQDPAAALRAIEAMGETTQPYNAALARLWAAGDTEAALAEIRGIIRQPEATDLTFVLAEQWATILGDPQLALDLRSGSGEVADLTGPRSDLSTVWDPYSSALRQLPGFKDWIEELGLVDYWRSTGNWADKCRPVDDDFECF